MSQIDPRAQPLLMLDDIVSLYHEVVADEQLLAELPDRIAKKKRKLDAAMLFAPSGFDPSSLPDGPDLFASGEVAQAARPVDIGEPEPIGKATWVSGIQKIVESADAGLRHAEIQEKLYADPDFAMRRTDGDKSYYSAIGKLMKRGTIVKQGGLLYSKILYDAMRAKKIPFPIASEGNVRPGGAAAIVLEVLNAHPKGLTGVELKRAVADRPDAPRSVAEHGQYIYNVLSGLIGRGQVIRKDDRYFAAKS